MIVLNFRKTLIVCVGWLLCASFLHAHEAPSLKSLDFEPPPPGTYALHPIMPAPDGVVLDVNGKNQPLSHFTRDKVTLLSFIYTSCADATGCPMAYQVFESVKANLLAKPALKDKVRFVSLSFDPLRDNPKTMRQYGGSHVRDKGVPWYFLTTDSPKRLLPLLDGFGQDVQVAVDKRGKVKRELSHVLKVFLIDRAGQVREIYTTSFLLPQVVVNDIETLVLEDGIKAAKAN